ncbi:RNA polymerase sigma-70 factor (ECF subfamily) [Antricoccus suffuscus]|uniref:RNA polymerase sigma-70 factor (ECF subfamily) n=1 Tax=Antricoccus suffuscus TaxID=1629062 RepID=A0A2T0ZVZ5_9ACTN|nr:sigma-70 family RNA polymerase sigma factor [Antricoccus suffuscus]PRZ40535.1 RNA polymerase sigma-70 factor (ECF subfamily) [Antricoccus suffuscus]
MITEDAVTTDEVDLMRALHDEHAPALMSYALRLSGGDQGRAEDIVQETLLRAWRRPAVLDQSQRSARGWLYTVAHNVAIDQWRGRKARPEILGQDHLESAIDGTDEIVQAWVVRDALSRLSAAHREVLVECYFAGRTVTQAAARIGVPAGTVKSRLHYALHALRLILNEMGFGQ